MNKYNELLTRIAQELRIRKGIFESDDSWKARIVYSAIGHLGIASLYDIQEDNTPISITHFKNRITNLYSSYLQMYPELTAIMRISPDGLANEIYDILLCSGCIYHSPNRISSTAVQISKKQHIALVRGSALSNQVFRSGLGAYISAKGITATATTYEMFGLHQEKLIDYWKRIISEIHLSKIQTSERIEFLRTEPPFSRGYYKEQPDKSGLPSLLRVGMPGSYLYYLYQYLDDEIYGEQLQSWQTDNYEYRYLANSCLCSRGCLPAAVYHIDGDIVLLRLNYLYPPAELNLIRLYSWPERFLEPISPFNFVLTYAVFLAIRAELEPLGYRFTEE